MHFFKQLRTSQLPLLKLDPCMCLLNKTYRKPSLHTGYERFYILTSILAQVPLECRQRAFNSLTCRYRLVRESTSATIDLDSNEYTRCELRWTVAGWTACFIKYIILFCHFLHRAIAKYLIFFTTNVRTLCTKYEWLCIVCLCKPFEPNLPVLA